MTDFEAASIQRLSIANGFVGVQPFRRLSYNDSIQRVIDDDFFDPGLQSLTIDFVTYEHLHDLHAHTRISIEATPFGTVDGRCKTSSMRLNNF
jgi:hypothetical protein